MLLALFIAFFGHRYFMTGNVDIYTSMINLCVEMFLFGHLVLLLMTCVSVCRDVSVRTSGAVDRPAFNRLSLLQLLTRRSVLAESIPTCTFDTIA